jgi:hypothetical protein
MKKNSRIVIDTNQVHEEQAKYIAAQHPIDRIRETVQLILRVYPLSKNHSKSIYIDKA